MLSYKYKEDDVLEVGIDEAGRGSLFGRLYTGAVILPFDKDDIFDHGAELHRINDSKKLTKRKRDILYDYVKEGALDWATGYAEPVEIDEMNILQADLLAMRRAAGKLVFTAGRYLIDGDTAVNFSKAGSVVEEYCIPQGDAKYLSIAGASIMAKVEHDRWIQEVCAADPELDTKYGLLSNMGYGTATHMRGLKEYGASALHRKSFKPVKDVIGWLGS